MPSLFFLPLARVNPFCQRTAPSDCIWRQFHLDSNFTQTDIGSPHFADCIFEEACNLEACKLAKPGSYISEWGLKAQIFIEKTYVW